jgi:hypothetical protein
MHCIYHCNTCHVFCVFTRCCLVLDLDIVLCFPCSVSTVLAGWWLLHSFLWLQLPKNEFKIILWPTVNWPVFFWCQATIRAHDQFFSLLEIFLRQLWFFLWHPLWREDGSVIYGCCWTSPVQSLAGSQLSRLPNLAGQVPIFIFSRNRVAQLHPWALDSFYDSQGYGEGTLTLYIASVWTQQKTPFQQFICYCVWMCCCGNHLSCVMSACIRDCSIC